jgi:hypothetical protein
MGWMIVAIRIEEKQLSNNLLNDFKASLSPS